MPWGTASYLTCGVREDPERALQRLGVLHTLTGILGQLLPLARYPSQGCSRDQTVLTSQQEGKKSMSAPEYLKHLSPHSPAPIFPMLSYHYNQVTATPGSHRLQCLWQGGWREHTCVWDPDWHRPPTTAGYPLPLPPHHSGTGVPSERKSTDLGFRCQSRRSDPNGLEPQAHWGSATTLAPEWLRGGVVGG